MHFIRSRVDDRLVVQQELIVGERPVQRCGIDHQRDPKIVFQAMGGLGVGKHLFIEADYRRLVLFGAVQRDLRGMKELFGGIQSGAQPGGTYARTEYDHLAVQGKGALQELQHTLRELLRRGGLWQAQREVVPVGASKGEGLGEGLDQTPGDQRDDAVTELGSDAVVDVAEAADLYVQYHEVREPAVVTQRSQIGEQSLATEKSSQGIYMRAISRVVVLRP